ncbi:MAG: hypothetical protein HGB03_01855 [Candidatus Yonathbacteria bacterium]|nr:hypothetical protein [Candidatus Yonathbacteria bacterium]NTW48004.1 hypothetical protein [Candidatus Yonathbacteria bacterium]
MTTLEPLTKIEFVEHLLAGNLRFVLVGMSNTGKSRRAKELMRTLGFFMYSVDELIANELGLKNVGEVGEWLGHPDSEGYAEREKEYLRLENKYTCLASLEAIIPEGKNLVFDTTGSVAHLPQETRDWLSENCLVVYLTLEGSDMEKIIDLFFRVMKPLIWGEFFFIQKGESRNEALRRCYPDLLAFRAEKYADMANIRISAKELWNASAGAILDAVLQCLPGEDPENVPWRMLT